MSRRGRPVLSWQLGCKVPENVPENTPGAWLTKLSIIAPGLRDREEGVLQLPDVFAEQLASGQEAVGLGLLGEVGQAEDGCWE